MEKRVFLKNMALLSGFASLESPVNKIEELLSNIDVDISYKKKCLKFLNLRHLK